MDLVNPAAKPRHGQSTATAQADPTDGVDAAVVAAIVAGDETAFLSLIERWSPVLTALATV